MFPEKKFFLEKNGGLADLSFLVQIKLRFFIELAKKVQKLEKRSAHKMAGDGGGWKKREPPFSSPQFYWSSCRRECVRSA